ncbi:ABC transporter permease subunit [Thiohalomonas denitrificans]|uniref:ABC-2 type transport system permease protein n=1 Tax=Thiohalomonas denitrificans TaxID=415747 RepID=A0A1G5PVG6_9GAMM|nr:ABC transporter permease subunit [Thiohalomonas denitrificans]SCZ53226.1 ABC-2 type transport system permease protein [Thiohalomonas denitrificans]
MMVGHIAARELRSLFLSPLAWSVLAVVELILAYLFLSQVDEYARIQPRLAQMESAPGLTEVVAGPVFGIAAVVLLLVAPLLTMRLISEERRGGTLPLLLSAPVSMTEIVLGKYLGVMAFFMVMIGLIALMPLSLMLGGTLDFGLLAAQVLGLTLMLAAFAAAGLFMSTLTEQPTVAAVGSFGFLLLLWILDWAGGTGSDSLFTYLSLQRHHEALLRGIFDTSDLAYYLLFITTFLVLSIRRLDAERLQG